MYPVRPTICECLCHAMPYHIVCKCKVLWGEGSMYPVRPTMTPGCSQPELIGLGPGGPGPGPGW
mgnify:CR=1 FL=1